MKIDVVTVCFNSQATIGSTIESFLRQRHAEKEMIVIDGASTDDTIKIVEAFQSPKIRIISEPDRGAYDAMNKGLYNFGGDAIGILNSDDVFHDDFALENIAEGLRDADIVYGDLHMVTDHQTKNVVRNWRAGGYGRYSFHLGWMPPHPTFYMRRRVVELVGYFDLNYQIAADYDYMLRAMVLNDFRIVYVPNVLVDFKMGGISTKNWRAMVQVNLECLRSRRLNLRTPYIDAALFLRPLRRILQLRSVGAYWSK